jgi:hypothetical protein
VLGTAIRQLIEHRLFLSCIELCPVQDFIERAKAPHANIGVGIKRALTRARRWRTFCHRNEAVWYPRSYPPGTATRYKSRTEKFMESPDEAFDQIHRVEES